jgi:outer membrane lipoprotein SlyB
MYILKTLILTLILFSLSGCAGTSNSNVYTQKQAQTMSTVEFGTVLEVKPVTIAGQKGILGGLGGALIGAIAGSTIGGGKGKSLATVAGGIGGAVVGSKIEEKATQEQGVQLIVELKSGKIVSIVQKAGSNLQVGDTVKVILGGDGSARVMQ